MPLWEQVGVSWRVRPEGAIGGTDLVPPITSAVLVTAAVIREEEQRG